MSSQQIRHHIKCHPLDGKQVVVFHVWAAAPHELCQAEQVLQVVARLPPAHCNLGTDLLWAGWSQVEWIVCGGDVHQRRNRRPGLLVWKEIHHLGDVATANRLTDIEVLEGLFHLGGRHLKRHAPRAGLRGNEVKKLFIEGTCRRKLHCSF